MAYRSSSSSSYRASTGSLAGPRSGGSRTSVSHSKYANSVSGGAYGGNVGICQVGDLGAGYDGGFVGAGYGGGAGFGGGVDAGFGGGAFYGGGAGAGFAGGAGFSGGADFGGASGFGGGAGYGFKQGGGFRESLLSGNEKMTMQNLNDRLANYLKRVDDLEKANYELEQNIREWHEKQVRPGSSTADYSHYYKIIDELRGQILNTTKDNHKLILDIDNTRLTTDDFRMKYENELMLHQTVQGDINGLRRLLDDLTMCRSDLESQFESLTEELVFLKKNHAEEMKGLQSQVSGTVSVEMNAAPTVDLSKTLADMRADYERIAEKYQQEAEERYKAQTRELQAQVVSGGQEVQTSKSEITNLRHTLQGLEIELQSQLSMKSALEVSLAETEGRYCAQLSQIQELIAKIQEEIADIRNQLEMQSSEYKLLLDVKTRLEQEIAQYRSLLDGQDIKVPTTGGGSSSSSYSSTTTTTTRVR